MSINLSIDFGFDRLPSEGEKCNICKLEIVGDKIVPYVQVGDPPATYLEPLCESCYTVYFTE